MVGFLEAAMLSACCDRFEDTMAGIGKLCVWCCARCVLCVPVSGVLAETLRISDTT